MVEEKQKPVEPKQTSEEARKKALDVLSRLDIKDRIENRQANRTANHSLLTILLPLWIWVLGLAFLPEGMPVFGKAMFHISCLGGFGWLAYSAWTRARESSPTRIAHERRQLEEDIERARRRREIRDS